MKYIYLDRALKKVSKIFERRLKEEVPVDTGKLQSSIRSGIKYKFNDIRVEIYFKKYGEYLDSGTKPHFPPVNSLKGWASRKGLNPYAIATNISKYGTKAQPWITTELTDKENNIIEKGYSKDLEKHIKKRIEK